MVSLNVINIFCAMSMIFRFRMLSDENDNFVRDYEVPYDMTLLDFHRFLLESLEYEECMTSFFTADERWEKPGSWTWAKIRLGRRARWSP